MKAETMRGLSGARGVVQEISSPEKLPKADRDGEKYYGFSLSLAFISSSCFPLAESSRNQLT